MINKTLVGRFELPRHRRVPLMTSLRRKKEPVVGANR